MFNEIGIKPREENLPVNKTWTKIVTPERYLKTWPNGPEAKLAQLILSKVAPSEGGFVQFYSPRSKGLNLVIDPVIWSKIETPAGSQVLQTPGLRVVFDNGCYQTEDPKIITYLTEVYKDKRFPVVRTDIPTKSAGHRYGT